MEWRRREGEWFLVRMTGMRGNAGVSASGVMVEDQDQDGEDGPGQAGGANDQQRVLGPARPSSEQPRPSSAWIMMEMLKQYRSSSE